MMSEDTGESSGTQEQFFGDGKVRVGHFTFNQDASRKDLARAVIMHEYPLSIVDQFGFRKFFVSLQPLFQMGSRETLEGDILKIYDFEKAKLRNAIERLDTRFAITTKMWTSKEKKGYMSVIAHYIDDSWVLQSRLLRFIYVPVPHTMDVLAQNLMDALTGWNIETKISTITVKNCTSGDGMLSIIVDKLSSSLLLDGKIVHMRCFARVLDLVVKDGLSLVQNAIERIRDSVAFWSATPSRVDNFEAVARQAKISSLNKLGLDRKTCWKSTYFMLKTAIWYKDLFPKLALRDEHYTCVPTDDDWKMAKNIAEKLEIFYNAAKLFSETKVPTANCYFMKICQLRIALAKWVKDDDVVISSMAIKMFEKFEKYWNVIHVVLAVAAVLDPRYKLKAVEFCFRQIYGDNALLEIEKVKRTCYELFHEYQRKSHVSPTSSQASSLQVSNGPTFDLEDIPPELIAFLSESSTNVGCELDHYLDEPILPWTRDFDILRWWKTMGFTTLQKIAKDFLALPVSTVSSDSAFVTSRRRLVNLPRSWLHPNTSEALMCSHDWLWKSSEVEDSCSSADSNCLCIADEDEEG